MTLQDCMCRASDCSRKIEELNDNIKKMTSQLNRIDVTTNRKRRSCESDQEDRFYQKQESRIERVKSIVNKKRQEVIDLLNSFPDMEKKDYIGKYEVKSIEAQLKKLYPSDLIDNYVCLNPEEYDDESKAYKEYTTVEKLVAHVKSNNVAGYVFTSLSAQLDKAADVPQLGMKVALIVGIAVLLGITCAPFIFLTALTALGIAGAAQGIYVQRCLKGLYNVKAFLNSTYDEDIFKEDMDDIMSYVDDFLEEQVKQQIDRIKSDHFVPNEEELNEIERSGKLEKKRLENDIESATTELQRLEEEITKMVGMIDELQNKAKRDADAARSMYLGTIDWKKEWMEYAFMDIGEDNIIRRMDFSKANSIYFADDISSLKLLSRTLVFQEMLHMHPDFASTVVLDYKYNGGELTQFTSVPQRVFKMSYTEEEISKQVESINNGVTSRTNNILSTCQSIEEFNQLMAQYDSTGEYYVVVHLFGLTSLPTSLISCIRNGPKVGYFFKVYATKQELMELASSINLDDFTDFWEIEENPKSRRRSVVENMLYPSS